MVAVRESVAEKAEQQARAEDFRQDSLDLAENRSASALAGVVADCGGE
jgi:hypothetical protein